MTNPFHGAIILLNSTPDNDTCDAISKDIATDYFPSDNYNYRLSTTLPEGTPVDVADQYTAEMKDLPRGATYLLVYPVEESKQL